MSRVEIPGYQVDETPIGRGCSGEVYRAHAADTGEPCVVKRYNSMAIDRSFLARLMARLAKLPPHEGILPLLAYRFDGPPYFAVTPFETGRKLLQCGKFSEDDAWSIIGRLAAALGHAHKHGVTHGNLHPGNIFYSRDQKGRTHLRVTDFGGGMCGQIHHIDLGDAAYFAPPEQLECLGADHEEGNAEKWDVYRFGAIAFWLLHQRFPRGRSYLRARAAEIANSGGRPVPLDPGALAQSMRSEATPKWGRRVATTPRLRQFKEIVASCLEMDPADRPVDLREVRNQFRNLEQEFTLLDAKEQAAAALNEAENRVRLERMKQQAKLFSARAVAAILGASFIIATFFLVDYFVETKTSKSKITELDQVVANQKAQISILGSRWQDAMGDLKQSREAADASFYTMTRSSVGEAAERNLLKELERARTYYIKVLKEVSKKEDAAMEKGRALHSLAHIEKKMGQRREALEHFEDAIATFEESLRPGSANQGKTRHDTLIRLADCHENIGSLQPSLASDQALQSFSKAVLYFSQVLEADPEDQASSIRLAESSFHLGLALAEADRDEEAISSYALAAKRILEVREPGDSPEKRDHLEEMLLQVRFQTAASLVRTGRELEAIDAYIATIEAIEDRRGADGFSREHTVLMASGFYALGELFRDLDRVELGEKDQVFNESLRLLTPLNRELSEDLEVASLMSRTLSSLAALELEADHWSDGYRLSKRSIEVLLTALEAHDDEFSGHLALARARLDHVKFFDGNRETSREAALEGVEAAEQAHRRLVAAAGAMTGRERNRALEELREIFGEYLELCRDLGAVEAASKCSEYASFKLSYQE